MDNKGLSPLAVASRDLVIGLSGSADPALVEAGCRDLLIKNINGFGSADTRVADVASEIVRGVLKAASHLRSSTITAAARGVSDRGASGPVGDAERLSICERACRDVRDSADASDSDYVSALDGAAKAALMSAQELRAHLSKAPPPNGFWDD